jgi:hypothetical protein
LRRVSVNLFANKRYALTVCFQQNIMKARTFIPRPDNIIDVRMLDSADQVISHIEHINDRINGANIFSKRYPITMPVGFKYEFFPGNKDDRLDPETVIIESSFLEWHFPESTTSNKVCEGFTVNLTPEKHEINKFEVIGGHMVIIPSLYIRRDETANMIEDFDDVIIAYADLGFYTNLQFDDISAVTAHETGVISIISDHLDSTQIDKTT